MTDTNSHRLSDEERDAVRAWCWPLSPESLLPIIERIKADAYAAGLADPEPVTETRCPTCDRWLPCRHCEPAPVGETREQVAEAWDEGVRVGYNHAEYEEAKCRATPLPPNPYRIAAKPYRPDPDGPRADAIEDFR